MNGIRLPKPSQTAEGRPLRGRVIPAPRPAHPFAATIAASALVSALVLRGAGTIAYVVFPLLFLLALVYHQRGGVERALERLAESERALADAQRLAQVVTLAEERFRSLFETAPYARIVIDVSGEIVLVNGQAEQMFGYDRPRLIGRSAVELISCDTDSSEPWCGPDALRDLTGEQTLELRARRGDGGELPVEVSLTPIATERGPLISLAVADITERKLAAEVLAHRASHDPLTGLPNRTLFLDRLQQGLARARRSGNSLAALFLDLDDFKLVNDTRGHEVGDMLLVALIPRLISALRPGDTIARFGGDEFVVLCEDLVEDSDAVQIAERISDACSGPVMIGDYEQVITVSTGVLLVDDPQSATPSGVLRDADAAMYRAKASGKGRIEVFDEGMRARLIERIAIESSLRRAIERGELRLFYQPVMSVEGGRIVAMEALLRWQHPHRGLLEPREFMSVAENTGLILRIGEWVIAEACRQAVAWQEDSCLSDPVRVSVNLSPRQVARCDVAATVARILRDTGLDPGLLELEVTESMLFEDADACVAALRALKQLGVRIVLDDFGTGYSWFGYLNQVTIDALKLDRSFVDSDDGAIVSAVLRMAGELDVVVTAEGVETSAQLSRLQSQGCEFAQGFLFSRPVPSDEVPGLLEAAADREQAAA